MLRRHFLCRRTNYELLIKDLRSKLILRLLGLLVSEYQFRTRENRELLGFVLPFLRSYFLHSRAGSLRLGPTLSYNQNKQKVYQFCTRPTRRLSAYPPFRRRTPPGPRTQLQFSVLAPRNSLWAQIRSKGSSTPENVLAGSEGKSPPIGGGKELLSPWAGHGPVS